jgi:hypothetical protein
MKNFVKIMFVVNVLIIIGMVSGCDDVPETKSANGMQFKGVNVEGCEYLASMTSYGYWTYAHKGNCKNPIHVYARKEDEDESEVKKNREDKRRHQ